MVDEKINTKTPDYNKSFHEQLEEIRRLLEENLRYTKSIYQATPKDAVVQKEEQAKVLESILNYTKASYAVVDKIRKWVFWQKVGGYLKLALMIVLVVVPIILGIIYLPPYFKQLSSQYSNILNQINLFKNING